MKTKIEILIIFLLAASFNLFAQNRFTAKAVSYDISDNLDLEAVATIFGQSKDLQDFEQRLNDPKTQISNLDLNGDGYVDYLRVVENSDHGISEVVIQSVLGDNVFQDVATIETGKSDDGNTTVQIVGDPYMYGPDYILNPVYVRTPLIFDFFWGSEYRPWRSPYYWGYYPEVFHNRRPLATFRYHRNLRGQINVRNTYNYTTVRQFNNSGSARENFRRNDYASKYPGGSFNQRHSGVKNKIELNQRRTPNIDNGTGRANERQIQRQNGQSLNNRERDGERQPSIRQNKQPSTQGRTNNQIETKTNRSAPAAKSSNVTNRREMRQNQKAEKINRKNRESRRNE